MKIVIRARGCIFILIHNVENPVPTTMSRKEIERGGEDRLCRGLLSLIRKTWVS
jgi:hypothetical protein